MGTDGAVRGKLYLYKFSRVVTEVDKVKLKLLIIVGTRPEIIRLAAVINKCRQYFDCLLAHTGQNYDYNLNGVFPQLNRHQCCSSKEEYEKECGRIRLVGGLGSKIMDQVLTTAKPALSTNNFAQMSSSQQDEWLKIGKKGFEWSCCLDVAAAK